MSSIVQISYQNTKHRSLCFSLVYLSPSLSAAPSLLHTLPPYRGLHIRKNAQGCIDIFCLYTHMQQSIVCCDGKLYAFLLCTLIDLGVAMSQTRNILNNYKINNKDKAVDDNDKSNYSNNKSEALVWPTSKARSRCTGGLPHRAKREVNMCALGVSPCFLTELNKENAFFQDPALPIKR